MRRPASTPFAVVCLTVATALGALACGGSSSETPFPPEPRTTPSRLQPIDQCLKDADCGDGGACVRGACTRGARRTSP